MFWSTKKKQKDDDKERLIKELRAIFPSIRRPNNDDSLFEIKFVVDNKYSSLRIFIPPDFPLIRPVLQAAGPITHPWLDQFKQVNGSEKLLNWTKTSSLVEVVEESLSALFTGTNAPTSSDPNVTSTHSNSVQPTAAAAAAAVPTNHTVHFASPAHIAAMAGTYNPSTTPPTPPNNNNFYYQGTVQPAAMKPSGFSNSSPGSSGTVGSTPVVSSKVERQTSNTVSVLELPSSFPELEKLSVSQLQRLLVDSVALEAHINNIESLSSMKTLVQQMRESNVDKAKKNVEQNEEVSKLKVEYDQVNAAFKASVKEYSDKLSKVKAKVEVPPEKIQKELKALRNQFDKTSEDIGTRFVDGDMDLSTFVQDYLDKRSKYHELCGKMIILNIK